MPLALQQPVNDKVLVAIQLGLSHEYAKRRAGRRTQRRTARYV